MPDYHYKSWEPDQELEEQQAEVYNEANTYKFQPATADHIKNQFTKYKIDPEFIKYAFNRKKMVGYVQARVQEQKKEIILSFPWTISNTPTEVRDTLFHDICQFFKDQDNFTDFKFRVNPMAKPKANINFLLKQGFVIENTWKKLLLSLSEVAKAEYDPKFTSRLGSEEDIEELIDLTMKDGSYKKQLDTYEKRRQYITEKIVPTNHTILVYEDGILGAACTPKEEENRLVMDFVVFRKVKNQELFIPLFVELAKACKNSGYGKNKPILVYTDNMDTPIKEQKFLQQFTPVQTKILMYYCYKKLKV